MTVCLAMIVRDEADWIESTLRSALALGIDRYVIADTGSRDATKEIVASTLADVPGEIVDLPWEGFGPTRSSLLRRAHGKADLVLMLDADMTVSGDLPSLPLERDAYRARIFDQGLEYTQVLLFSGARPWRYEGIVHPHPEPADGKDWTVGTSELRIADRRPGGWRPGKLEEDARLLEAELERNPLEARSSFYLAQTYADLGRSADAIREYGRRALLGGWDEEVYVAKLRRARLLQERDPQTALAAFLDAWQARPTRAESLYCAARLCRIAGWDDLALLFARRASEIDKPADRLFVETATYAWGIPLELAIAELRTGDRDRGLALLERLSHREDIPQGYRDWIDELRGAERPAPLMEGVAA